MIQYILTDIEGTTTSVNFVYEVLFPYFSTHFQEFAIRNQEAEILKTQLQIVKETVQTEQNRLISEGEAIEQLLAWTLEDRKHPALKLLQGLVWQEGYQAGKLKGHIYTDVPPILEKWKSEGKQLGIYSSGSVQAQKLLFQSSDFGDLTPLFTHYFDTAAGNKREVSSYQNIQQALALPASTILFLSDIEQELDAAQSAGFQTIQLVRDKTIPSAKHLNVPNFAVCAEKIISR
jgi:enolase-phosphatase E1